MTERSNELTNNLHRVQHLVSEAAARSGRRADAVKLIGITKYVDAEVAGQLFQSGCSHLGESRPQALWQKAEQLRHLTIHWHLVGHLQRNKIKRTVEHTELIHSADSLRLLEAIQAQALQLGRTVDVLLEVNVSGEAAKHGFAPHEVETTFEFLASASHVNVRGLMCMAALEGDLNLARTQFASLRSLRDDLQSQGPSNVDLRELSMGMSRDFEVAIEEGATMVRVGSILFESPQP